MAEEDWHMPIEYYQHIIFIFFLQLQSFMATHCSQYIIPIYPVISEKHHLLLAGLFYIPDSIQCRGGGIDTPTFTPKIVSFRHVENVKNVEKIAYFKGLSSFLETERATSGQKIWFLICFLSQGSE